MHYEGILPGVFLDRPNRFIAHVALDGAPVVCHVKNTGRCRNCWCLGLRFTSRSAAARLGKRAMI